jgi:hypothetical protein
MDDVTDLMGNTTIDIDANYVQKDKTEEVNVSQFTSDIDLMLLDPSSFSEDGFALLCAIKDPGQKYIASNYTRNTVREYLTAGTSFSDMLVERQNIITSNLIDVYGSVTIKISKGFKAFITIYDNQGKYTGKYYGWLTNDKVIYNAQKIAITLKTVESTTDLAPDSISSPVIYYTNMLQLPIVSVSLQDESMNIYNAVVQNWYASWNYLINFYLYDLPAHTGTTNTLGLLYSLDIKKSMKHTIEFHAEEDLNELQLIKTSIGNGKIESVSVNLDTRLAKVNLMYEPK